MRQVEITKGKSDLLRISKKQEGGSYFTLVLEPHDTPEIIQEFLKRIFDFRFAERIEIEI
jgi:hypothetical protein